MTCYHPLKAFVVGFNEETGKNKQRVTSFDVDHLYLDDKYQWRVAFGTICPYKSDCNKKLCRYDCDRFNEWYSKSSMKMDHCVDYTIIPCGQCIGCRMDKSREWANRMMLELLYSRNAWFVTFTYDDEHVPHGFDSETGEVLPTLSLCKEEFRRFNKDLRHHYGEGIRFFASGEYGDRTHRPHYHVIYFNLDLNPETFVECSYGQVKNGRNIGHYWLYRCPELESLWKRGRVIVGQVNWNTCAYVGRYVTKKLTGKAARKYEELGIEPVFSLMSRRPGIGMSYFRDNKEKIYTTCIIRPVFDGKHFEFRPPKYYDRLAAGFPELKQDLEQYKLMMQELAKNSVDLALSETDKEYLDYLRSLEYLFEYRIEGIRERSKADA